MNIEEWDAQFKPVTNHLDSNASWDGVMFETYGAEETYVFDQDPLKVWTYVDGDDGNTYLINGLHLVNRIGYLICEVPYDEALMYEIRVNEPDDSISWGELAKLTHATQVERFNFCLCEEQEQFPYDDCPRKEN